MELDVFLIVASALCLVIGLAGCILPALPGIPVSYVALILITLTDAYDIPYSMLVLWLLVVVVVSVADFFLPSVLTKRFGGSRLGSRGALVGTVAGLFFVPFGLLVGPFLGAVLGEMVGGKQPQESLKAGFGAFVGFFTSMLLKIFVAIGLIIYALKVLLW
ncbi:MAG: DUF456 domain-containing protein [Paludibacteraceae bacterium]|nr:DUF456 domain-containing protein [Paludibacteraceae bacterium]